MIIQSKSGLVLPVTESRFPDGQVHVQVTAYQGPVVIQARLRNGDDLFSLLLAEEACRSAGATSVDLFISYLLGARMDRRITSGTPFTLKVVANCLRGHFDHIQVLDPHSDVACALLDAEPVLPFKCIAQVLSAWLFDGKMEGRTVTLCAPDAGAEKRVYAYAKRFHLPMISCSKHRDMQTGELSGFTLADTVIPTNHVLITDDICDGGRTFSAVAELLKSRGATWVGLYVTHGIFSRGFEIPNIDQIFTTASYRDDYPKSVMVVDDRTWMWGGPVS